MIRYDNLSKILMESFPKIERLYLQEKDWYEDMLDLPHIFYGDLLTPFMLLLLEDDNNSEDISEIFLFLEKLAKSDDSQIREVVQTSVLERIGDDKEILKTSYKYMGEATRKLSDEIEESWGRLEK